MRDNTRLIQRLEKYRMSQKGQSLTLTEKLTAAWIFHDHLVEGRTFNPEEIMAALRGDDDQFPSYFSPLFNDIRDYAEALEWIIEWSEEGPSGLSLERFESLHRHLLKHEPKEGAAYRKNSPVHRDYHQPIVSHKKVEAMMHQLFTETLGNFDPTTDDIITFAASVHHQLMFIYPYRRSPGLVARLFTNQLLMAHGYPPVMIAGHERGEYYDALAAHEPRQLVVLFQRSVARYLDMASVQDRKVRRKLQRYAS